MMTLPARTLRRFVPMARSLVLVALLQACLSFERKACTPGRYSCDDLSALRRCNDDGQTSTVVTTCGSGMVCSIEARACVAESDAHDSPETAASPDADTAATCESDEDCDDGKACTEDVCLHPAERCAHTPKAALCNDSLPCTDDLCSADGTCTHASRDAGLPCPGGFCDDGGACTPDRCVAYGPGDDTVALWHFDDVGGAALNEATGAAELALATTGTVSRAVGKFSFALGVSGGGGAASSSAALLTVASGADFSLEGWIRIKSSPTSDSAIVSLGDFEVEGAGAVSLEVASNGMARGAVRDGTITKVVDGKSLLSPGTWHHLALVRTTGDTVTLFVDFKPDGSVAGFPFALDLSAGVLVGARREGGAVARQLHEGSIDEVRFSKVARSATDFNGCHCAPGLLEVDNQVCIGRYEASVWSKSDCSGTQFGTLAADYPEGFLAAGGGEAPFACSLAAVKPSRFLTLAQAKATCQATPALGARLCHAEDWVRACRGREDSDYPYGATYDAAKCNVNGAEVNTTDKPSTCVQGADAPVNASGNVAEWVQPGADGKAFALGGSHLSTSALSVSCSADHPFENAPGQAAPIGGFADIGFRCCADPIPGF